MVDARRLLGQAAVYGAVALVLGYFSAAPAWRSFPAGQAMVKLSLAHGAKRAGECRRLSREELMKLPPNMRKPVSCPRRRLPIHVRLAIDGETMLERSFAPAGLAGDGPSQVYRTFAVQAGRHTLVMGLRDTDRKDGFDYTLERSVELSPGQNLAIGFRPDVGGFTIE